MGEFLVAGALALGAAGIWYGCLWAVATVTGRGVARAGRGRHRSPRTGPGTALRATLGARWRVVRDWADRRVF